MPKEKKSSDRTGESLWRVWLFPFVMALVYAGFLVFTRQQGLAALRASWKVLVQILPAMAGAFVIMIVLNLWVKPVYVKRFLGRGTGMKGVLLSSIAGILSMGPIYAWYPLLREFRGKGVSNFHLANFLGCRALMEISFKGDTYEYSWGSLPSLLAVVCLFLCVVFMFLACRGHNRAAIQQVAAAKSEKPEDAENAPTDPSSRLQHLAESQSNSVPAVRK